MVLTSTGLKTSDNYIFTFIFHLYIFINQVFLKSIDFLALFTFLAYGLSSSSYFPGGTVIKNLPAV